MTPGAEHGRRVDRAVAWVGLAAAIVAAFDAATLAILLWKWVSPADLGLATLATTLFFFLDLSTEAGLTSVLIQRDKLDDDTTSSVFWLNVIVSIVVFLALLGVGPLIGYIHGDEIVGWMLIAYGFKLLYQNVYFVPAALLRRELRFKELSVVRTIANAVDSAVKIGFAAAGEPVWCFVAGPLARIFVTGIGLQIIRPWRPRRVFHAREAPGMLAFGFKTTGSQYLQHYYNNISYQIVGFYFGEAALGIYRVAYELVMYPINWVSSVVTTVAFPAFARLRTAPAELAAQFLRFSRQNLVVALPLLVLPIVAAEELLAVLFPGVHGGADAARLLCVVGLLRAIDCMYLPLLDGIGRAGRNLAVAGVAAVVLTGCDVAFAFYLGGELGITAVAVGRMVGYPLVILLHAYFALAELPIGARRYVGHLSGLVACGAVAVVPGFAVGAMLDGGSPSVRLVAIAGAALATLFVLLAVFHGLRPRKILEGLR